MQQGKITVINTSYLQAVDLWYTTSELLEECRRTRAQTAQIQQESRRLQAHLEARQQCYIVIICAWCQRRMGVQPTALPQSTNESHGICQSCGDQLEAKFNQGEDAQLLLSLSKVEI